ncbi:hypothetical protein [Azohydromonas australica]|uniref:hypothetical protein n=1 Tax=Azohydromonas australica TaxID=364039 RepID=UPI00146F272A|nr:hypothetical protein [Azohydromonas australica]
MDDRGNRHAPARHPGIGGIAPYRHGGHTRMPVFFAKQEANMKGVKRHGAAILNCLFTFLPFHR